MSSLIPLKIPKNHSCTTSGHIMHWFSLHSALQKGKRPQYSFFRKSKKQLLSNFKESKWDRIDIKQHYREKISNFIIALKLNNWYFDENGFINLRVNTLTISYSTKHLFIWNNNTKFIFHSLAHFRKKIVYIQKLLDILYEFLTA